MVETIKSNGDRVVDTCVRDDTLNTTVKLNCTLATVSDSVVPMINLESKLHVAGVVSRKDPSLATIEDPGHANIVEQRSTKLQRLDCTNPTRKEQTINCNDKVSRNFVCSNTFDALMINYDQELRALSTPILQVSILETTRIIKEPQTAMLNKANPMVKPPMATINT
ncbi:hypothetical protein R3W88_000738 [Solanum pinnatisectum]|uniref:Uncharacterized protein n=1 Tax=Solanum pinnatisectum TaxID=50273 RepID=A0AAV9MGU5_9SOLN|nr:hypothetical protein R3W88_000738 [Solanum pinnatisectum]